MELFKNKNANKITSLKNCSAELRNNEDYAVAVIKELGLKELEYVGSKIAKNATFWVKLITAVPKAAEYLPDTLNDTVVDEKTKQPEQVAGYDVAFYLYQGDHNIYKHLKVEDAYGIREFQDGDSAYGFNLFGTEHRYMPVFWPTFVDGERTICGKKGTEAEGLKKRADKIKEMDKMRPDVVDYAKSLEDGLGL